MNTIDQLGRLEVKKLWIHPRILIYKPDNGLFGEEPIFICEICQREIPGPWAPFPCKKPWVTVSMWQDFGFILKEVQGEPFFFIEKVKEFFPMLTGPEEYYLEFKDEETENKLQELARKNIKEGPSYNGWYPLSEELENFLEEKLNSGKIVLRSAPRMKTADLLKWKEERQKH